MVAATVQNRWGMRASLLPRIAGALILLAALTPAMAVAQADPLAMEMEAVRQLKRQNRLADASDRADGPGIREALNQSVSSKAKEMALWELADIHLEEANKWGSSGSNTYARRAIAAWTAYVEFAVDNGVTTRLHSAVEYLQRSYMKAKEYPEMFSQLLSVQPRYVNNKVFTRWEDQLRACAEFDRQGVIPWAEKDCAQPTCRDAVAGFYHYAQRWLGQFPLKTPDRDLYARRIEKVPASCRVN